MSKPALVYGSVLLLAFAAGLAMVLYFGDRSSGASAGNASASRSDGFTNDEARDRFEQNVIYTKRIRELEDEVARLKAELAKSKAGEGGKSPFAFLKKHRDAIRMSSFKEDLQVTPEMAELLGLSDEEKKIITDALRNSRSRMKDLAEELTHVASQTPTSITLEIPVDPRGKEIHDQLQAQLASTLGADRADVLMNYGDFNSYSDFDNFAQTKKGLSLSWTQENGKTIYTSSVDTYSDNGSHGRSTQTSQTFPASWQRYLPDQGAAQH